MATFFFQPDDQPCIGELALMPNLGASHFLLNADHNAVYMVYITRRGLWTESRSNTKFSTKGSE